MCKSNEFEAYVIQLHGKRAEWLKAATKYGAKHPEDVVQDSFIKLIEWRQRNEDSKYNDGLFFFIVRNTALDESRKGTNTTEQKWTSRIKGHLWRRIDQESSLHEQT